MLRLIDELLGFFAHANGGLIAFETTWQLARPYALFAGSEGAAL